jgi:hypothetical protein
MRRIENPKIFCMPYLSKSGLLKVQKLKTTNIQSAKHSFTKRSLDHGIFATTKMHLIIQNCLDLNQQQTLHLFKAG